MGNTKNNYGIFRVCSLRNLSKAVESISNNVNRYMVDLACSSHTHTHF